MKIKSNWKNKFHFRFSTVLLFFLITILTLGILFFMKFNKEVTPKLLNIAEVGINKLNETILTNYKVKDIYPQVDIENAIVLTKNKKDEIISVDFKLEEVYKSLSIITGYLQRSVEDANVLNEVLKYYNEDLSSTSNSIILSIPMGVASDKIYLANLGPRIPVKVSYMGYVASSVRIKLEDYGINNVLISIYIDCFITNSFITPSIEKEIKHEYNILVASKIIQGIVPTYYGGVMEAKSNILNVPIN